MAENEEGQEKKHEPSQKKRDDAAEKGQIARSADLSSAAVLLTGGAALAFAGGLMGRQVVALGRRAYTSFDVHHLDLPAMVAVIDDVLMTALGVILIPLGAACVGAIAAGLAQTGGGLAPKALEPKFDKLDPRASFKSMYLSPTPWVELAKGLAKLLLLGGAVAFVLQDRIDDLPGLAALGPVELLQRIADLAWTMLLACTPILLAIAAGDYAYSAWRLTDQLKMTDQEMKEQNKNQEGDPMVKAQRRAKARQIAMGSLLAAVRDADVVVTNPTHYAVALRYKRDRDAAPVVVAKGVDHMALKIRQEALKHGIPRIENRPLARGLYAAVRRGQAVPEQFYGPVARVLAVVYRRRAARRQRR